jgi:predicted O-methyltransferase YrrM
MSRKTLPLDERLYEYLIRVSLREHSVQTELREVTARLEEADMQISPEQGQFMALLVRMLGARRALEVGVFTGYSALCVALALPEDGTLVACDVSEEWTSIGRKYWRKAGIEHRIDLRIGPALETLQRLVDSDGAGTFDFAFIDADKLSYPHYYELCLRLLRPGGVVAIDNVLWDGKVADDSVDDPEKLTIAAFNKMVHDDGRVDITLVPIADGLTLARKREVAVEHSH